MENKSQEDWTQKQLRHFVLYLFYKFYNYIVISFVVLKVDVSHVFIGNYMCTPTQEFDVK